MKSKPSLSARWAGFILRRETKKSAATARTCLGAQVFFTILLLALAIILPMLDIIRHPPIGLILYSSVVMVFSWNLMLYLMLFERKGFVELLAAQSSKENDKGKMDAQSASSPIL